MLINELSIYIILFIIPFTISLEVFYARKSIKLLILWILRTMAQLRSIHQIFRFIQIGGILTNIWPNYPNERKLIFILRKIDWSFNILNLIAVEISLMCTIYKYWDDVTTMMKTLAQFFAGVEMLLNLIIFKLKSTHIQVFSVHCINYYSRRAKYILCIVIYLPIIHSISRYVWSVIFECVNKIYPHIQLI